jgi:hypothetical protein
MLTTHVDIEVLSDAKRKYEEDTITRPREFIDLVNKNSDLIVYGKPTEDEYRILSQLLAGRGDTLIKKESEISCSHAVVNSADPFQLFFAAGSQFADNKQANFFTASLADYEEKFKALIKESTFRVSDPEAKSSFSNWSDIVPEVFFSDIVLVDPFIIESANAVSLENNLYSLIRAFREKHWIETFFIFTNKPSDDSNIEEIRKTCREILGYEVKFGLIYFDKNFSEHDRYLIMNYNYINSGNSFSSFFNTEEKQSGKRTSTVRVLSYVNPSNFENANDILYRVKQSLDVLISKNEKLVFLKSRLFFFADSRKANE